MKVILLLSLLILIGKTVFGSLEISITSTNGGGWYNESGKAEFEKTDLNTGKTVKRERLMIFDSGAEFEKRELRIMKNIGENFYIGGSIGHIAGSYCSFIGNEPVSELIEKQIPIVIRVKKEYRIFIFKTGIGSGLGVALPEKRSPIEGTKYSPGIYFDIEGMLMLKLADVKLQYGLGVLAISENSVIEKRKIYDADSYTVCTDKYKSIYQNCIFSSIGVGYEF